MEPTPGEIDSCEHNIFNLLPSSYTPCHRQITWRVFGPTLGATVRSKHSSQIPSTRSVLGPERLGAVPVNARHEELRNVSFGHRLGQSDTASPPLAAGLGERRQVEPDPVLSGKTPRNCGPGLNKVGDFFRFHCTEYCV